MSLATFVAKRHGLVLGISVQSGNRLLVAAEKIAVITYLLDCSMSFGYSKTPFSQEDVGGCEISKLSTTRALVILILAGSPDVFLLLDSLTSRYAVE